MYGHVDTVYGHVDTVYGHVVTVFGHVVLFYVCFSCPSHSLPRTSWTRKNSLVWGCWVLIWRHWVLVWEHWVWVEGHWVLDSAAVLEGRMAWVEIHTSVMRILALKTCPLSAIISFKVWKKY